MTTRTKVCKRFVGLIRVSTEEQAESGLGLGAGRAQLEAYCKSVGAELITVVEETGSGTKTNLVERPKLLDALTLCRTYRACLLVPKLDRLLRSEEVYVDLKRSGVSFRAVDIPEDDDRMLLVRVWMSQDEAKRISERTKAALGQFKAEGRVSKARMAILQAKHGEDVPQAEIDAVAGKLGAALVGSHLTEEQRLRGSRAAGATQARKAREDNASILPIMQELKAEGLSLAGIAERLNDRNIPTRNMGRWSATQVKRVLDRAKINA